jgi:hypothetical protein
MTKTNSNNVKGITNIIDPKDAIIIKDHNEQIRALSPEVICKLKTQILSATLGTNNFDKDITVSRQITDDLIKGIDPKNEIEGMLAAQMVAIHNAAMTSLMYANTSPVTSVSNIRDANVNQAVKLSRTYATLMQTLHMARSHTGQKVNVERVHVHDGGQAIVGNVIKEKKRKT